VPGDDVTQTDTPRVALSLLWVPLQILGIAKTSDYIFLIKQLLFIEVIENKFGHNKPLSLPVRFDLREADSSSQYSISKSCAQLPTDAFVHNNGEESNLRATQATYS
jgi:hypothetical protein